MSTRKNQGREIMILYEDNHLIAVDKPPGVLVHADETGDMTLSDAIKNYIKEEYDKPGNVYLGVIHRIDRPVSGVVLFAKTSKALARMNRLFQERKVTKTYRAIVNKRPEPIEGMLTANLSKNVKKNRAHIHTSAKKGKESETFYSLLAGLNGYYYLHVEPITGRSHQIRAHLKSNGTPIVGDLKYGYSRPNQDKSICLHCNALEFIHPVTKEEMYISSRIPRKEYWSFFQEIEKMDM